MILVIGSTGNIGRHVVEHLKSEKVSFKEGLYRPNETNENIVKFDFLDHTTFDTALKDITKVFFIRPPQIGNPNDIYPFLDFCKTKSIQQVVFVSLMGVEKNPIPPHAKIEKYIKKIGLPYTFIRPSFFMENLIYPHGKDIKDLNQIIVPAKRSKTSFIAAQDIGEVCATVLMKTEQYLNQAHTITGPEALDYFQVAELFSTLLQREIVYTNPTMNFYAKHMIENKFDKDYVKITKLLYFMTRLGTAKMVNQEVSKILNRPATKLKQFIESNMKIWI